MTATSFRRIALSFAGAAESAHMDHPDFRANRKIFATLTRDGKQGMVKLTPAQQQQLLRDHPAAFTPAAGAWGRQGCTMVQLSAADPEVVGASMTLAWQNTAASSPRRAARPAKGRPKPSPRRTSR
jgi:hypothetical protein